MPSKREGVSTEEFYRMQAKKAKYMVEKAAVEAAELAHEAGKSEEEISRAACDAAWLEMERGY